MKPGDHVRVGLRGVDVDARVDGFLRVVVLATEAGALLAFQRSDGLWYNLEGENLIITGVLEESAGWAE